MSGRGQVTQNVFGLALAAFGFVLTFNVWSARRIGGHALDDPMFLGPTILTVGLFVFWGKGDTARGAPEPAVRPRPRGLLILGLSLLAVSLLPLILVLPFDSEVGSLYTVMAAVNLGFPGIFLLAVGVWRYWRDRLRRAHENA
jgi:hypothetical protein